MYDLSQTEVLYTIFYIFLAACFVAPPTEFVSAGLTLQNVLSSYLGSEELGFIYYHIKRTSATVFVHSLIPLGYYVGFCCVDPMHLPWATAFRRSVFWRFYFIVSVTLPVCAAILIQYWRQKKWEKHPIAVRLSKLVVNTNWRAIASSINLEFRRVDKFVSGSTGRRIYVTDTWVLKMVTYHLYVAHHDDIHLTVSHTDEMPLAYDSSGGVQFLNIIVGSVNDQVSSFSIRLNALEYGDLRLKLTAPIRMARDLVIRQSLSDYFLEDFKTQVSRNECVVLPSDTVLENCIGCLTKTANVMLDKKCDNDDDGACSRCYCRPMWCIECMGKWFASRQDQQHPEMWMGSASPCPTCRANFCMLDVSYIQT